VGGWQGGQSTLSRSTGWRVLERSRSLAAATAIAHHTRVEVVCMIAGVVCDPRAYSFRCA
jgi:hypothetical protein